MINAVPIEDKPKVDATDENYIQDLETEITTLKAQVKKLSKALKHKPKPADTNCCEAYKLLVVNFHKLIDDILPF